MMNGDRVTHQLGAQKVVCLEVEVENGISAYRQDKIEHQVSSYVSWRWEQSWPWNRIQRVEQAVREQARDNWEMLDGEGRE
jgi:hypothetical protein